VKLATVVTNAGEEYVVDKINETVQTEPEYVGWGTGAGTAAKADTDLFTPVNTDPGNVLRLVGTSSKTGSGATAKYQLIATLQAVSGITATNAGAWTAVSGGTLVIHGDHTSTVLATGDKIEYTFTIDPS
jgi:hypothetical protein